MHKLNDQAQVTSIIFTITIMVTITYVGETIMASVLDVAAYILKKQGSMTAMKLQKIVYYSQAWSLVWDEKPLFSARIEAWANGPVVPHLYREHQGKFKVQPGDISGNAGTIHGKEQQTIDAVLKHYGNKQSQWLSDLTHQEEPWKSARKDTAPGKRSSEQITNASMAEYYGSL